MQAAQEAQPIAITNDKENLIFWFLADEESVIKIPCISEKHAEELALLCHRAFGMRTKENSFATGLLHRDLQIGCSL
jgi:hypothetical protein